MNKLIILVLIMIGINADLLSQTSASASAKANIIQPINIASTLEVNLGTVAVIVAGEIEVVRTVAQKGSAAISLPCSNIGTFTAASFFMESTSSYAFTIEVPPSPLEIKDGNRTMIVNSWKSDPILNPESGLIAGVYVSVSPLNLTVNYN